jgi:hypothetical protein
LDKPTDFTSSLRFALEEILRPFADAGSLYEDYKTGWTDDDYEAALQHLSEVADEKAWTVVGLIEEASGMDTPFLEHGSGETPEAGALDAARKVCARRKLKLVKAQVSELDLLDQIQIISVLPGRHTDAMESDTCYACDLPGAEELIAQGEKAVSGD